MASGSRKKDEPNPFSFKNFVRQKGDDDLFGSDEEPFPEATTQTVSSSVSRPSAAGKKRGTKPKTAATLELPFDDVEPLVLGEESSIATTADVGVPFLSTPSDQPTATPPIKPAKSKPSKQKEDNPFSFKAFVKRDPSVSSAPKTNVLDDPGDLSQREAEPALPATLLLRPSESVGSESSSDSDEQIDDKSLTLNRHHPAAAPTLQGSTQSGAEKSLRAQLSKAQEENAQLRNQLQQAQQAFEEEKKRCAKLRKKLETQQKKEAEETAALENMMHMVEKNLEQTTQRAIKAENTIQQLKQELSAAQAPQFQQVHEAHDQQLFAIRDKAQRASSQLLTAAGNADKSIKELLSGIDTLKLVADLLASIDRFSEAKHQPS